MIYFFQEKNPPEPIQRDQIPSDDRRILHCMIRMDDIKSFPQEV